MYKTILRNINIFGGDDVESFLEIENTIAQFLPFFDVPCKVVKIQWSTWVPRGATSTFIVGNPETVESIELPFENRAWMLKKHNSCVVGDVEVIVKEEENVFSFPVDTVLCNHDYRCDGTGSIMYIRGNKVCVLHRQYWWTVEGFEITDELIACFNKEMKMQGCGNSFTPYLNKALGRL